MCCQECHKCLVHVCLMLCQMIILENSGLGCYVAGLFAGAIAYADDLVILSASVYQLQLILGICADSGKRCDLVFNCEK